MKHLVTLCAQATGEPSMHLATPFIFPNEHKTIKIEEQKMAKRNFAIDMHRETASLKVKCKKRDLTFALCKHFRPDRLCFELFSFKNLFWPFVVKKSNEKIRKRAPLLIRSENGHSPS